MPSSLFLRRGTISWPSSAQRPWRALPVRLEAWCPSSTRSSWSQATRRERGPMPTCSSPSTAPMGIRAVGSCGRSSATSSSASRRTASCWRCWTWESCRKSGWSTTTPVWVPAGCWTAWRSPTRPTASPPSFSAGSGWTLRGLTGRSSGSSTRNIRKKVLLQRDLPSCLTAKTKEILLWHVLYLRNWDVFLHSYCFFFF